MPYFIIWCNALHLLHPTSYTLLSHPRESLSVFFKNPRSGRTNNYVRYLSHIIERAVLTSPILCIPHPAFEPSTRSASLHYPVQCAALIAPYSC
ncbi:MULTISPECIES: hypothetical protein [Nitrosomonas]|uniref:hypothetical protein n=1 Tax=Nitrosomonas TaxID=914 RepID=UPI0011875FC2|nr:MULTISPECIES: hypothetical protein [Nitrosomonas]UVS62633.1 hypothetical protein NX761_05820 [Nitrosomonas sp. PLL12]